MDYRALTVSATLAITALAGLAPLCRADIVASENGIAVQDAGVAAPRRGMTMSQVASKFGAPVTKIPAVGNPPISRWDYPGFVVYFERDYVIHSVVSGSESPGAAASGEASAPTAAAPAPAAAVEAAPASSPPAESEAPPAT
jgi:outer membrane protein assembly factor BamE (lipoprotein component of BamABCDE complex)